MNFAIFVTYFLIEIQLLCMGIHVIVQKFHFSMMRICVDDHRCSELRYGHCKKDYADEFQQFDLEDRWCIRTSRNRSSSRILWPPRQEPVACFAHQPQPACWPIFFLLILHGPWHQRMSWIRTIVYWIYSSIGQSQFVDNEYRWPCYNPKPVIFARFYKDFYYKISWVIIRFLAGGDMRKYVVFPMVFEAFLVVCNDLIPWQGVHPDIIASISGILHFSKVLQGFLSWQFAFGDSKQKWKVLQWFYTSSHGSGIAFILL